MTLDSPPPPRDVPLEIKGWNWGAFLLNLIWGLWHNLPQAFLMLVPGVNLVMAVVLGFKGNEWAWQRKPWASVAQFKAAQRKWAIAGFIVVGGGLLVVPMLVGGILLIVYGVFFNAAPVQLAMTALRGAAPATERLGAPISQGFPTGCMRIVNASGYANVEFPVTGPKGKATVTVIAEMAGNQWRILRETIAYDFDTQILIESSDPIPQAYLTCSE